MIEHSPTKELPDWVHNAYYAPYNLLVTGTIAAFLATLGFATGVIWFLLKIGNILANGNVSNNSLLSSSFMAGAIFTAIGETWFKTSKRLMLLIAKVWAYREWKKATGFGFQEAMGAEDDPWLKQLRRILVEPFGNAP